MSYIPFSKYQGTGNDFVLIDNRNEIFVNKSPENIQRLCDRRFGIGGDGLILLESHDREAFTMVYYNADGRESTMCGNGGRCIAAFAYHLGLIGQEARFEAIDGLHRVRIEQEQNVALEMKHVTRINRMNEAFYLDSGSPHYVKFVKNLSNRDVVKEGRDVRNSDPFREQGVNVNFVELLQKGLFVRTYERGVEHETYSCGTGVIASAISAHIYAYPDQRHFEIYTRGGTLEVTFETGEHESFTDVWLKGPAELVFHGEWPMI